MTRLYDKRIDRTDRLEPVPVVHSIAGERETLQIEPLSYPAEIIDQVLVALRSSNELLPMEQRRMGSHEVGYLARC